MTVTLTINVSGRRKGELAEMALETCGTAGYEFEHTPEEISSTLRLLDTLMAEWPWSTLGYEAAGYGAGLPEDPSGLAEEDVSAVVAQLALRRAPGMGASLAPEARAEIARSYSAVCSRAAAASMPTVPIAPSTPRGMGRRRLTPFITETGE